MKYFFNIILFIVQIQFPFTILGYSKVSVNGRSHRDPTDNKFSLSRLKPRISEADLAIGEVLEHPSTASYSKDYPDDLLVQSYQPLQRYHPPPAFQFNRLKGNNLDSLPPISDATDDNAVLSKPPDFYNFPDKLENSKPTEEYIRYPPYPPGFSDSFPMKIMKKPQMSPKPQFVIYKDAEYHPEQHDQVFYEHFLDDHPHDHHLHHDYHHVKIPPPPPPPPPEMVDDQRVNRRPYSYYYIGRKLWYVPLYFSIYFIIYIAALVLKSVARHKINFPINLAAAAATVTSTQASMIEVGAERRFRPVYDSRFEDSGWLDYAQVIVGEALENFGKSNT